MLTIPTTRGVPAGSSGAVPDLLTARFPAAYAAATGLVSVSDGFYYYADRTRNQVNANITHYADKFGHHDLKFGAEFERSTTRDRYGYAGGFDFYDYGGVPYYAYSYSYDISAKNTRQSGIKSAGCWQHRFRFARRITINISDCERFRQCGSRREK